MSYCLIDRATETVIAVGFANGSAATAWQNEHLSVGREIADARVLRDETESAVAGQEFPRQPYE